MPIAASLLNQEVPDHLEGNSEASNLRHSSRGTLQSLSGPDARRCIRPHRSREGDRQPSAVRRLTDRRTPEPGYLCDEPATRCIAASRSGPCPATGDSNACAAAAKRFNRKFLFASNPLSHHHHLAGREAMRPLHLTGCRAHPLPAWPMALVCEGSMHLIRVHQRAVHTALFVSYIALLSYAGWIFTHLP